MQCYSKAVMQKYKCKDVSDWTVKQRRDRETKKTKQTIQTTERQNEKDRARENKK